MDSNQNQNYQGQNNNYYQNQNMNYQGQNHNYYQNQNTNYQGQNQQQNYHYQNNPYADPNYRRENPGNGGFMNHNQPYMNANYQGTQSVSGAVTNVMTKTFLYMVIALSLSTIAALLAVKLIQTGRADDFYGLLIGAVVVEIISLIIGNVSLSKGNALAGGISFIIYSLANGVTLSSVFFVYQIGSIVTTFVGCAAVFGVMALIGFVTKKDLTGVGNLCLMVLIGVIVMTLLNFLFKSAAMDYMISYVGVALFAGLTAYDTQKIKNMAQGGAVDANIIGLWGALELYLDFLNLFLYLLKIFGKRNN